MKNIEKTMAINGICVGRNDDMIDKDRGRKDYEDTSEEKNKVNVYIILYINRIPRWVFCNNF